MFYYNKKQKAFGIIYKMYIKIVFKIKKIRILQEKKKAMNFKITYKPI